MKKINLIYFLALIFMIACGGDDDPISSESSNVVERIVPLAGTRTKEIKQSSSGFYLLQEAEFSNIFDIDFGDNMLLVLDTDAKRDLIRLIIFNDETLNSLNRENIDQSNIDDQYSFTNSLNFVRFNKFFDGLYFGDYFDIFRMKLFSASPLLHREDATYLIRGEDNTQYIHGEDYQTDQYAILKDGGPLAENVYNSPSNTNYPDFAFFINNAGDMYYKEINGIYKMTESNAQSGTSIHKANSAIKSIVMTENENFFYSTDSRLFFWENGKEDAVLLEGSGNTFQDITALAIDNEHKLLFVGNGGMIHVVKLKRL